MLVLFMFAVWAATAVLSVGLINEGLMRWLGEQVDAKLISFHEHKSAGGSYHHTARYRYSIAGRPETEAVSRISWSLFLRLREPFIRSGREGDDFTIPADKPQTIKVRGYAIGPLVYNRPVEHEWGFMFLLIPAIFTPLGLLLGYVLYLAVVVRPRRYRALFTHGTAVAGQVSSKRTRRVKHGEIYYVYYTYTPAGESAPRSGYEMVGPREFESVTEGQAVTVLYNTEKPKRSAVYEYGSYVIEGRDMSALAAEGPRS
jgi:hypothetical protein